MISDGNFNNNDFKSIFSTPLVVNITVISCQKLINLNYNSLLIVFEQK